MNTIQSGNLDIVLEYIKDDGTWVEIDENTKLFDDAALWEPGHTEVAYLKITNAGSLALSYRMAVDIANEKAGINMEGNSFNLSDYIEFGVVESNDPIDTYADRAAAQAAVAGKTTKLQTYANEADMLPGEDVYIALVVYMPTTVGNVANHKTGTTPPSIGLGVNVFATQMPSESDSFGNDYDKDAFVDPVVFDADATYTVSAIKANGSNGVLQSTAGTLTINGSGTVTAEEADDGYAMAVWANGGDVVIEGGNFTQTITGSDEAYDLIYASNGGSITIKGGTFKSATPAWTLNVKDADRATSHITVMGGNFYQFNPANANTGEGEISVHEDYKVVQNGDWYEVVKK